MRRPIEAELLAEGGDGLIGGALPQHLLRQVARQQFKRAEDDDGNSEKR